MRDVNPTHRRGDRLTCGCVVGGPDCPHGVWLWAAYLEAEGRGQQLAAREKYQDHLDAQEVEGS